MAIFSNPTSPPGRGDLVSFNYPKSCAVDFYQIHDPSPIIIITDVFGDRIRGLNLHYLPMNLIRQAIRVNQNSGGYSYAKIRGDITLRNIFRIYIRRCMLNVKRLDAQYLLSMLDVNTKYTPEELDGIRASIRDQMNRDVNVEVPQPEENTL